MDNDFLDNDEISIKHVNNDFYLEKNNIILDKTCPSCDKILTEENYFCDCGFFLKASSNSKKWSLMLATFLSIVFFLIISFTGIGNLIISVSQAGYKNHFNFNSISPVSIQVISSLKNSPYKGYIQSVYVRPHEENKLMILIKPNLWYILTKQEKKDLLNKLTAIWNSIYKENNPSSSKKPEVNFSNN